MRFSVIIPTYNEQEYIERCLQSIVQQTYDRADYEIIVSDAQSTDETVRLALNGGAKVANAARRGIAYGRNIGAQQAQGDLLVFVDADVTLHPEFLSHLAKTFSDERVVAATGKAIPADGNLFPRFVYRATYALVNFFNFFHLPLFPALCVVYRKTIFETVGGFREDFGITEDLDLSKRVSTLGACKVNNDARAFVSTRRLEHHALSTVLFHIYHDLRYLLFGKTARVYPKSEELNKGSDLWRMNRKL
ncbi:MAG TPA: glycosyltransferase [Bacteroidota bacterium]